MTGRPPRLALWLVARALPASIADDVAGDLEERWRADPGPRLAASARLLAVTASIAWHGLRDRLRPSPVTERGPMTSLASLQTDIRFALRLLLRSRLPAAAVVTTLALGIGGTVTLFALIHAWVIRPLPFTDPDRLVAVWETIPSASIFENTPAPAVLNDWQARATSFEALVPYTVGTANLTGGDRPLRLRTLRVAPELLGLLGRAVTRGRDLNLDDARGPDVGTALLSARFWQEHFGGRDDAVGQVLRLDGRAVEVVGVLPPEVRLLGFDPDLWVPLVLTAEQRASFNRILWVVGRLRPSVDVERASAELDRLALERSEGGTGGRAVDLQEQVVGTIAGDVLLLLGASALVLLIGCANVASLTLSQMMARRRELVTRAALGASRWRIARQVLIEALVVSLIGGAAGLLLAAWLAQALAAIVPGTSTLGPVTVFRPAVVGFALGGSLLTAVVAALIPVWHASRRSSASALRDGARGSTAGRQWTMRALVTVEVALAMMLLVATTLVFRSLRHLSSLDLGFETSGLVMAEIPRPAAAGDGSFFAELERRLRARGIDGVALSQGLPLMATGAFGAGFAIEGQTDNDASVLAYWRLTNAGYFGALGQSIVQGRAFDASDVAGSTPVAVVSESFAKRAWPGSNPIGRRIGWGTLETPLTVVGVAADIRQSPTQVPGPHVYMPYLQSTARLPEQVALRSDLPPATITDVLRETVASLDPDQPIARLTTADDLAARALGRPRFHAALFGAFAAVAMTLALVGLYGVLSFLVAERRREVGIRLALGATPASIRWLWLRHSLAMTAAGLACGAAGSWAAGRLMAGLLTGVTPADPASHALAVVLVGLTATAASLVPASRAAGVDPVVTLAAE